MGITYPQYLVMKILMEQDGVPVNVISARLMLESNTVTPLSEMDMSCSVAESLGRLLTEFIAKIS